MLRRVDARDRQSLVHPIAKLLFRQRHGQHGARRQLLHQLPAPRDQQQRVFERAQAALDAAKAGRPLAAVKVGTQTAAPEDTGPFVRSSPFVPKVGEAQGLLADAFAAKAGQVLPRIYDTPSGPVVAVVKLRESPDAKAFDAQREAVATRLRNRKESQVQGAWLKALRADAKIETNSGLLAAAANARGE